MLVLLIVIIALAFIFDLINGFHDAANAIATIVSTRVLSPLHAVAWAAFFNFMAVFFIGVQVATTIGTASAPPLELISGVGPSSKPA